MPLTQVDFPGAARDFSPSHLSVHTLLPVSVHPCVQLHAFNICVHDKDPVVHVGVWWIMETLKHPASTKQRNPIIKETPVVMLTDWRQELKYLNKHANSDSETIKHTP